MVSVFNFYEESSFVGVIGVSVVVAACFAYSLGSQARSDRLYPVADLAMCQAVRPLVQSNNPRFAASDGVPPEATIVGFRGASVTGGLTGPYRRSSGEENLDDRAI
nr:unnamed protein product [Digitaria exilis]